jgi:hypothetical protein
MNLRREVVYSMVWLVVMGTTIMPVRAGGPLYVTGPSTGQPGKPYRWALNPIPYQTDQGGLGNQTNAQANDLVLAGFQVWHSASTSDISFSSSGQLSSDITSTNVLSFQNDIGDCSNASRPINAVVYDVNGSIMTALGYDNNSILGFSGAVCADDATATFTRGWTVLNGRFIDGQPDSSSHASVTLDVFKAVLTHEFGHLIGLDHSQINLNCMTGPSCSMEDMAGLPVMFPVLLNNATNTLKTDDVAAVSVLYPASNFSSTTGRIQGRVLFSDSITPAQGYNVIARLVSDPRRTAASCVSGYLFTAAASNLFAPAASNEEQFYGSQDPSLIGFYDIPGLPSGDYTIEVEAIYNSGELPFVGGSSVGPIGSFLGFQYKLPGNCDPQYLNFPSSSGDSCSAKSTVSVGAGVITNTGTDVIFLGTPPRYDSWEDGP